jgi:polyisoprenyl-teichoic acid--peptidoglycan teichoic acid transferase
MRHLKKNGNEPMDDLKPLKSLKVLKGPQKQSRKFSFKLGKKSLVILGIILLLLAGFFFYKPGGNATVFHYVFGKDSELKQENGKINVLLLGIGGGGHDGPNLTDTIMVASYDLKTKKATLISLPRDLWVDSRQARVNAIYQMGLDKGDGLGLTKSEIGQILGLSIPYAIRIDFDGFVKAIDLVGGVDVEVTQSFDDYEYPLEGHESDMCGYQEKEADVNEADAKNLNIEPGKYTTLLTSENKIATVSAKEAKKIDYSHDQVMEYFSCRFEQISFKKGSEHLDGVTALKYVRSRHGTNLEGTDFARSRRQQQVIQAFKSKALSTETLLDLPKVVNLIKTFGSSIDTDIPQTVYPDFIKMAKDVSGIKTFVIDGSGEKPLLISPNSSDYGGAWVLVPPEKNYARIQQTVLDQLSETPATESGTPQP